MYYFIFKGISLIQNGGRLGFIVARYFINSAYASKLRQFLLDRVAIKTIIDFGNVQIFHNENVLTLIIILRKEDDIVKRKHNKVKIVRVKEWKYENSALLEHVNNNFSSDNYRDYFIEVFNLPQSMLSENSWSLINSLASGIKQKMSSNSWSLGEICDIGQSSINLYYYFIHREDLDVKKKRKPR